MNNKSRKNWVDYAKAIGIILVVYGHVARGTSSLVPVSLSSSFLAIDQLIYSFHMPLFFFLSGLFFSGSLEKYGSTGLIKNKISTVLYPYVLWSLLQGFIEVGLSHQTNHQVQIGSVLSIWEPRAQFWFLYALFFCFVFAVLLRKIFPDNRFNIAIIIGIILYSIRDVAPFNTTLKLLAYTFIFFEIGVISASLYANKKYDNTIYLFASFILFIISQVLRYNFPDISAITLLCAISGIFLVIAVSWILAEHFYSKILELIGLASLSIYLMHIIFGSGARIFLLKFLHVENIYIHIFIGMLVGIVVPTLIYIYAKKYNTPWIFTAPSQPFKQKKKVWEQ